MLTTIFEDIHHFESTSLYRVTRKWSSGETSVHYEYRETPALFEDWGYNGNLKALVVAAISTLVMAAIVVAAMVQ